MPLTAKQHRVRMQLAQMSRGWRAELDRRLAGLNLSQARWLVLLHLARFEEAPTQRELAQSVGVNVIPWSGSGLTVPGTTSPPDVLRKATLADVGEALACVKRVGYPCMIKASEGGGGKGIRKVTEPAALPAAFRQVQGEVPGSPIFIMRLARRARHLEVQLLADEYGAAIALYGRDCSVQRRHQKVLEEAPAPFLPAAVRDAMGRAAVDAATAGGYAV
jgi:acetyl-CoA carboxylase/biotin carboxylase 1